MRHGLSPSNSGNNDRNQYVQHFPPNQNLNQSNFLQSSNSIIANNVSPVPTILYLRLSRMSTDLLRPANLESFLNPTIPLTYSSVKTVLDKNRRFYFFIKEIQTLALKSKKKKKNFINKKLKIISSWKKLPSLSQDAC